MDNDYLLDSDFLKEIDELQIKELFVKITSLNFKEEPIEEIQGLITGGNLNLDGKSSMRRSCNLSLIIKEQISDLTFLNTVFALNKKVKVEIGVKNSTLRYLTQKIIWFPLGVYVITSPSISHGLDGVDISLQLKDKMCLLNGECGGTLPAAVSFHEYEILNNLGEYTIQKPTIIQIIRELVNHFGNEDLSKIIISDIPERIKQVMKWTGSSPLYSYSTSSQEGDILVFTTVNDGTVDNTYYTNQDVGYIYTDFVYPSELVSNIGDSVCSILDKIRDTLGNFEYFYDVYGNFIFQQIKNSLNNPTTAVDASSLANDYAYFKIDNKSQAVYNFSDGKLINSYSNAPQYNAIKNDFIIWGNKKNANGNSIPIRYHLAIDKKPSPREFSYVIYKDPVDALIKCAIPKLFEGKPEDYKNGIVGYYYLKKIKVELILAAYEEEIQSGQTTVKEIIEESAKIFIWNPSTQKLEETTDYIDFKYNELISDWRFILYLQGLEDGNNGIKLADYASELIAEFPKLYDFEKNDYNLTVKTHPEDLDYYLDFIDISGDVGKFQIENIGKRSKVISDNTINCLFEPRIPDVVLIEIGSPDQEKRRDECKAKGQKFSQVSQSIYSLLSLGGNRNSAFELIRSTLNEYLDYSNNITLSLIPIYYLEPNTRITVKDIESGISGDYIINSISIPLNSSSTMNINATKMVEKI